MMQMFLPEPVLYPLSLAKTVVLPHRQGKVYLDMDLLLIEGHPDYEASPI